jgi:HEPN domain-containing protein
MAERSGDWISQARHDLAHAASSLETAFYDWSCFASQQAAEKAVKAVFQRMGALAWGHSIHDLLSELATDHPVPSALLQAAKELDKAYILTRDPDAYASGTPARMYTRPEAEHCLAQATATMMHCESLLSDADAG